MQAPAAYTSGESTAVIRAVQPTLLGRRPGIAAPRTPANPARPWGEGPRVLVHNAETLARVALIARGWQATATALLTVAVVEGSLIRRTVLEAPTSATLRSAVAYAEPGAAPTAVLLGGYGGQWVAGRDLERLTADPGHLRSRGVGLGAGVLLLPPADRSLLQYVADLADYLAGQSARQCGPCMFGLRAVAERTADVARRGRADGDDSLLRRVFTLVEGRGGCRHPDGVVRMVRSALQVMDEAEGRVDHPRVVRAASDAAARPPVPHAVREVPVRLHVDRTACTGVGMCARVLPAVIDLDPWGYPIVRDHEAVADPSARKAAQRAVRSCPRRALSIRESPSDGSGSTR